MDPLLGETLIEWTRTTGHHHAVNRQILTAFEMAVTSALWRPVVRELSGYNEWEILTY